jgi:multidrug efflux pump subunit AcrB
MIEFFLSRRVLANLLTLFLIVVGTMAFLTTRREMIPEFTFFTVLIETPYPGASPAEVEELVTVLLEDEIRTVDGIDRVESYSVENLSVIVVRLDDRLSEAAVDRVVGDLQQAVNRVRDLPKEAEVPVVREMTSNDPIVMLAVAGGALEVRDHLAEDLEDTIKNLPGMSKVDLLGDRAHEIWVEANPHRLLAHTVSLEDIARAIAASNVKLPGGSVVLAGEDVLVRTAGPLRTAQDVSDVLVRGQEDGRTLRVRDVARVRETFEKERQRVRVNGEPAIILMPKKKRSADALQLIARLKEVMAEFTPRAQQAGVSLVLCWDQSHWIERRLNVMTANMVQGGLLILGALFVFLDWRLAVVAMLGVPISFASAMIGTSVLDVSINMMTLLAFIVVLGMLDDDSVVVAENIYRHLEMGKPPTRAAIDGAREVALPVLASVATVASAYLPFLLVGGIWAKFLMAFPIVVMLCFAASLLEAFWIMPAHVLELLRFGKPIERQGRRLYRAVAEVYRRVLAWTIHYRYRFMALLLLFMAGTAGLAYWRLRLVLFPAGMLEQFMVQIEMAAGTPLARTEEVLRRIEQRLDDLPGGTVQALMTGTGVAFEPWDVARRGPHRGQVWAFMRPGKSAAAAEVDRVLERIREELTGIPGFQKMSVNKLSGGPPVGKPVSAKIRGPDLATLRDIAEQLKARLAAVPGIFDIHDSLEGGKAEYLVALDERKAGLSGLRRTPAAEHIFFALEGGEATRIRRATTEVKVRVKLPEDFAQEQGLLGLEDLLVPANAGRLTQLQGLVAFQRQEGLPLIEHVNFRRAITVTADVAPRQITGFAANRLLEKAFAALRPHYPGYDLVFGGEEEQTQKSFATFMRSFGVTLLLDFLILAVLFNSYVQPFVVLGLTIPTGIIGAVYALLLHGEPFSFMAVLGIVAMVGVVINNAIVLVSFINRQRATGVALEAACLEAGCTRLRAIWASSITTLAGLLPTAYGWGGGEPFVQPMARAMAWGLAFAMPFTLFLIPMGILLVEDSRRFLIRLFRGNPPDEHRRCDYGPLSETSKARFSGDFDVS